MDAEKQHIATEIDFFDYFKKLNNCENIRILNNNLSEILNTYFGIIESAVIEIDKSSKNQLSFDAESVETPGLKARIDYLIEEGIIDWALQSSEAQIIMDLQSQLRGATLNILMLPLVFNDNIYGLFVAYSEKSKNEFDEINSSFLKTISEIAGSGIYSLTLQNRISKLEHRIEDINTRLIQSLPMTTFGEISLTVLKEAALPLQIIESNIDLIESGVGNTNRRLEIIKQQTKSISEIINLLSEISLNANKAEPEILNLVELIEEVKSITASQLKSRGLKIEFEFEKNNLHINAIKTQLEYSIVHLLIFFAATEMDTENIFISINEFNPKTILLAIKSENSIFDADNYDKFVELVRQINSLERLITGFHSAKNIIRNAGGRIDCNSHSGQGTIFRIYLPVYKV